MWSYYDLLNTIRNRALKKGIFKDKKYKYTLVDSENPNQVRNIFISTPALDYSTDESTLPERYNTAYFRNIRSETNDKDMFEAVYQQNPVEPPQFIFGWSRLMKGVPLNLENYETFAMIDPVREGQNYFAMAILRRYKLKDGNWSKCYLIDVIYKFDTNDHCLPYVVQKIVTHNIIWLGYETNVDLSFTKLIKIELKNYNYFDLEIKKIYTNKNKQAKISMARYGILNEIIYPPQELFSVKSEFGLFMAHLTTWQFFGKNAYDDSPDCLAMFVQEAPIFKKGNKKTLYVVNRIL